jgi:glucosamine-6-phosphate deaminase
MVWAHFGINKDQVHHMRLGFYSDDIFLQYPNYETDVKPLLELFEAQKPLTITLALDPEGSGQRHSLQKPDCPFRCH